MVDTARWLSWQNYIRRTLVSSLLVFTFEREREGVTRRASNRAFASRRWRSSSMHRDPLFLLGLLPHVLFVGFLYSPCAPLIPLRLRHPKRYRVLVSPEGNGGIPLPPPVSVYRWAFLFLSVTVPPALWSPRPQPCHRHASSLCNLFLSCLPLLVTEGENEESFLVRVCAYSRCLHYSPPIGYRSFQMFPFLVVFSSRSCRMGFHSQSS